MTGRVVNPPILSSARPRRRSRAWLGVGRGKSCERRGGRRAGRLWRNAREMNQDEFTRARAKIMAQGFPSSGGDLEGIVVDFNVALDQSPLLTLRSVKKTGDPERMIEARCEPAADTLTIPEV